MHRTARYFEISQHNSFITIYTHTINEEVSSSIAPLVHRHPKLIPMTGYGLVRHFIHYTQLLPRLVQWSCRVIKIQVRRVCMMCFFCIYSCRFSKRLSADKVFSSHLVSFNEYHVVAGADDGIEEIEGGGVILKCLQTRTGIKFVLTWVVHVQVYSTALHFFFICFSN